MRGDHTKKETLYSRTIKYKRKVSVLRNLTVKVDQSGNTEKNMPNKGSGICMSYARRVVLSPSLLGSLNMYHI